MIDFAFPVMVLMMCAVLVWAKRKHSMLEYVFVAVMGLLGFVVLLAVVYTIGYIYESRDHE